MKTLKFELDGQPLRVYLDRSGAVFVDVKDLIENVLADDKSVVDWNLEDHPAARMIGKRPVWEESDFFHIWLHAISKKNHLLMFLMSKNILNR